MSELIKVGTQYKAETGNIDIEGAACSMVLGGQSDKFVPNINFSKWFDECWLNINHADSIITNQVEQFIDGVIDLNMGTFKHRYYIDKNGHLEHEIVFLVRPLTNSIKFKLDFPKGLRFIRQPALTSEEISSGHFRPDNVINSYAVKWNKTGEIRGRNNSLINNYMNGKFCHIYRPKLIDSNKNMIWADLDINPQTKEMVINMDPIWLNNAIYPITLDPTFGKTAEGLTSYGGYENKVLGLLATGVVGTGVSIHVYGSETGTNNAHNAKCALYINSNDNLVSNGTTEQNNPFTTTAAYKTFNFSTGPTLSSVDYIICCWANSTTGNVNMWYDSGAEGVGPYDNSQVYNGWENPGVFEKTGAFSEREASHYVTYSIGETRQRLIKISKTMNDLFPLISLANFAAICNRNPKLSRRDFIKIVNWGKK